MKKCTAKLMGDIITNEFDNTRDFLLSNKKPISNDTIKRYILNIRNNILTLYSINGDIILTQKEKEYVSIMITIHISKLVQLINQCSENVSRYYVALYINSTRDKCVKALHEYYSEYMHKEIIKAFNTLVDLYTDMISE